MPPLHETSAQHSRHVDRKLFKMRELRGANFVTVSYIPTEDNPADLFTKILTRVPFEKHLEAPCFRDERPRRDEEARVEGDVGGHDERPRHEPWRCFRARSEWRPLS